MGCGGSKQDDGKQNASVVPAPNPAASDPATGQSSQPPPLIQTAALAPAAAATDQTASTTQTNTTPTTNNNNGSRPGTAQVALSPSAGEHGNLATHRGSLQDTTGLLSRRVTEAQQGLTVPPGTTLTNVNYCDPTFFPNHMEQCWGRYAAAPAFEVIDKKGIAEMGKDCINAFMTQIQLALKKEHPSWKDDRIMDKLNLIAKSELPGTGFESNIEIAKQYLAHELKFTPGSGVTKACFFLHFPRAHRNLFQYQLKRPDKDGLEREALVQRLQKQNNERMIKSIKSTQSVRLTKTKTNPSRQSTRRSNGGKEMSTSRKSGGGNMFGDLDFSEKALHHDKDKHDKHAAAAAPAEASKNAAEHS